MAKKKRPRDVNQLARQIVDEATGEASNQAMESPAAKAGRLGGLSGGKARAAKLSKAELSESARKAARARWAKKETD